MNDTTAASIRYDSVTDVTVTSEVHELQEYVSDVLALERHIREPIVLQGKAGDTATPEALRVIARIDMMTDVHIQALQAQLDQLGGNPAIPVKSAIAALLGAGAAAIDGLRTHKVSKALRDDYTALSLASISYTMLYTVALGYGDGSTAALAKRHLSDITSLVAEIARAIPGVILQELLAEGHAISPEAKRSALLNTHDAWSNSGT